MRTVKGFAGVRDGEVLGIGAVMMGYPMQAFSTISDEAKQHKRDIVKAVRLYRDLLNEYDSPIFAKPNPEEKTAVGFLKHVGFEYVGDGVYQWNR